ncbi:MAG: DM13 domain-containing protein [Rubrobacteraceae bacterium]
MIGRLISNKVFWVVSAAGLAIVLYLAVAVFGVQAAFIDREVDEEFSASSQTIEKPPTETIEEPAAETTGNPDTTPAENDREDAADPPPEPEGPERVSAGTFHDVEYEGTGEAVVYRLEDGSHVLRLENLDVDNGPDLFVYAMAAGEATDSPAVEEAGFVNAGPLKGNQGNQTYALPADFDPQTHRAISIWCQRFSANFVTAPLGMI